MPGSASSKPVYIQFPTWISIHQFPMRKPTRGPGGWAGSSYGWELDVSGTYKMTNNLSYMVGAGYWWVGDYYKGLASEQNDVRDEYMFINKLTLTF